MGNLKITNGLGFNLDLPVTSYSKPPKVEKHGNTANDDAAVAGQHRILSNVGRQ